MNDSTKTFENEVPQILFAINEIGKKKKFENGNRGRYHVLLVEGPDDKIFYEMLFREEYIYKTGSYDLRFSKIGEVLKPDSLPYYILKGQEETNKKKAIIDWTKEFTNHRDKYSAIDLYGFVDRDYEDTIKRDNIQQTETHDLDTNIICCYLPDLFKRIKEDKKETAKRILTKVLSLTTKLGVLVKVCSEFTFSMPENDNNGKLIRKCNGFNFKDESTGKDFDKQYEQHLESVFRNNGEFKSFYNRIKNIILDENLLSSNGRPNLGQVLKKWLIEKTELENLEECDRKLVIDCLTYSNGHLLIQGLLLCNLTQYLEKNNYFEKGDLKEREESFKREYLNLLAYQSPEKIQRIEPLETYVPWRINNNYIDCR